MNPPFALVPALLTLGLAACTAAPAVRPPETGDLDDVVAEEDAPEELSVDVVEPAPADDDAAENPSVSDEEQVWDELAEDGRVEREQFCFLTPIPGRNGRHFAEGPYPRSEIETPCYRNGTSSVCLGGVLGAQCHIGVTNYAYVQHFRIGRECEPEPICCADTGIGERVSGPEAARPARGPGSPCAYDRDGRQYVCNSAEAPYRACVPVDPDSVRHECINHADRWVLDGAWRGAPCTDDAECAAAAAANCPTCPEGGARTFCAGGVCRRVCGVSDAAPTEVRHSCGHRAYRRIYPDGFTFTCANGKPEGDAETFEGPPCFTHGDCDTIIGAGCKLRAWDAPWPAGYYPQQTNCKYKPCEEPQWSGVGGHGVWRFRCINYACRAECTHPYVAATESMR